MPCQTGGCWSCALDIDSQLAPVCIAPIRQGLRIETDSGGLTPRRLIGGFMAHRMGGSGTPWWLIKDGYLEAACFAAGCNLLCPQCQNWRFSIDLKALRFATFMGITGLEDEILAGKYLETSWKAVKHLLNNYPQVFLGIGIGLHS